MRTQVFWHHKFPYSPRYIRKEDHPRKKKMAMSNISHLLSLNFVFAPTSQAKHFFCSYKQREQRDFSMLAMASSSLPFNNVEYLEKEFKSNGISFAGIGDSCVVKMRLDNGSVASLMVPSGLITSYKPHMWYGSTMEVLHTTVSEADDGDTQVQGGVSMDFQCGSECGVTWSPRIWALHDVKGGAEDFIQVELICRDSETMVEFTNTVTLQPDVLVSEVVVSNRSSSSLQLTGSFISHLAVSTPDATFAVGLEGSDYYSKPPFLSDFSIIPPEVSKPKGLLQGLLPNWGNEGQEEAAESNTEDQMQGEEKDNYASLAEKTSRIYTSAPREYTIIDRGRRNSVAVGTDGFGELYIFSPGSDHEWYGKYAYICTGPSAMLKPIVLDPNGGMWRGMQFLHNPNL